MMDSDDDSINIQIFVPELEVRKHLTVLNDDFIWDVKRKLLAALPQPLPQAFNYGLFLPPCDGRAGKFLLEDRTVRDYPFHDCVPYLELKYKKRVYKMLNLDEKQLKSLHTKSNLKKFMEYVQQKNAEKVEKMCSQGLDANFHDAQGETPLTLAAGVAGNRHVLVALIGGGAHIDFRNSEGQTAMHKASFLSSLDNVKTLLELGASPNYRDPIGLTPLYYNMLTADSNDQVAEMLLREAADVGVTDMHGNHEIHQACKNGLVKHVEHLLYFGGTIDAENVNGNTPLHVCAVNNRPECARVLLFRGSDHLISNKQGQTALHVSHIVGHTSVADVIAGHNPGSCVPYRGTPQYSTRRRLSSTIGRRRSLSQSSLCSQDLYRTPQNSRRTPITAPSPTPSRASRTTVTPSEYGTMRRYMPDSVRGLPPGHEANTPRILVIPRGPKGFGFILRGAKHMTPGMEFEPTPMSPAQQYFEGVDVSGMAMKAGLRPGDYLLEIDGLDVRCANHDQVVHLIQQAGDTITLKVITIDTALAGSTIHRRHLSVGRAMPPPPPNRHPSTSLSMRGSSSLYGFLGNGEEYFSPGQFQSNYGAPRTASVKHRTGGQRISAAELENLMTRQAASIQHYHPLPYDQSDRESIGSQTPKTYNSVSDLKKRKQRPAAPMNNMSNGSGLPRNNYEYQSTQQPPYNSIYGAPMKTYASSPDIPHINSYDSMDEAPTPLPTHDDYRDRRSSIDDSEYSRPYRPLSRPKTPPPPPPPQNQSISRLSHNIPPAPPPPSQYAATSSRDSHHVSHVMSSPAMSAMTSPVSMTHVSSAPVMPATSQAAPPPPPPPPPPPGPSSSAPPPPPPPPPDLSKMSAPSSSNTAKPSLLASALQNQANALRKVIPPPEREKPPLPPSIAGDFHNDLKNALAKRRSKVAHDEDDDDDDRPQRSMAGLSLKDAVRENVQPKDPKQHSPPGIAAKKDSGYTSSRTSLEPSEYGEDKGHDNHYGLEHSQHKVSLISQHIEDGYGRKNVDNMSVSSSLSTLSGCSSESKPRLPPVDYDEEPDSGTGDSDCEFRSADCRSFERKEVADWTPADVLHWLDALGLDEYRDAFRSRRVTGGALSKFDRAAFTQLGVTRIGHRQKMEASIRSFVNNNNNA